MLGKHVTVLKPILRLDQMFRRKKSPQPSPHPVSEDKEIGDNARKAITESRMQIGRAQNILESEVRRLDQVLEGKK
jgi:hypothetical protein